MSDVANLLAQHDFLTNGGTETYMYFQQGFEMRDFCAFEIYEHEDEFGKLERNYLHPLLATAAEHGQGLMLDSLLWRASPDYLAKLGYKERDLERINSLGVSRTRASVEAWRRSAPDSLASVPVLVTADIGPRGDGYQFDGGAVSAATAERYHRRQIEVLAEAPVDLICALTMTSADESTGIVKAAESSGLPIIISPTVETDGRVPDGSSLADFITRVDVATDGRPLFYMVNCAHPAHLLPTLQSAAEQGAAWLERFKGFRANSSRLSHEELDNSTELDRGSPSELACEVAEMKKRFGLKVVGGCCGTDVEHVSAIARETAKLN